MLGRVVAATKAATAAPARSVPPQQPGFPPLQTKKRLQVEEDGAGQGRPWHTLNIAMGHKEHKVSTRPGGAAA